jgi:sterol desaturase/sphingolipid hydroxylase (fatty acid hydroxylase superfamily)
MLDKSKENMVCYMKNTAHMKKPLALITTAASFLLTATQTFAQSAAPLIQRNKSFVNENTQVENIPTLLVNIVSALAVVLAVLYLMFGGIKLITAHGDRAAVESARKHIFSAVIGLVVVFGTFLILQFIFNVLGADNPLSKGFTLPTIASPAPSVR